MKQNILLFDLFLKSPLFKVFLATHLREDKVDFDQLKLFQDFSCMKLVVCPTIRHLPGWGSQHPLLDFVHFVDNEIRNKPILVRIIRRGYVCSRRDLARPKTGEIFHVTPGCLTFGVTDSNPFIVWFSIIWRINAYLNNLW